MALAIRDAEHFHDPSAVAKLRASPLAMANFRRNLRFALAEMPEGTLAHELAGAVQDVLGSKGKAFDVLDEAAKEVAK
jgi:hypothetical protein